MFKEGRIDIPSDHKKAKRFVNGLLAYSYENASLDHHKMRKRFDYELDDFSGVDRSFCSGEEDCRYSYVIDENFYEDFFEDRKVDIGTFKQIHEYVLEHGARQVKIGNCKHLILKNQEGINRDRRGIKDLDWILKFYPIYAIERRSCISLHDIIIACYKVKSHKFENNYELIYGASIVEHIGNTLEITMDVEHGS